MYKALSVCPFCTQESYHIHRTYDAVIGYCSSCGQEERRKAPRPRPRAAVTTPIPRAILRPSIRSVTRRERRCGPLRARP